MTTVPAQADARPAPVGPVAGARAAQLLAARMPDAVLRREEAFGEETVYVTREGLVDAVTLLRDDPDAAYAMPVFVTAVDFLDREPRFDVVYQLRSLMHNDVCRLVVQVTEDDPTVPSLEGVMAGLDWHERETFDLMGIVFEGHHDLRRILLPDDWEGHPLRKDYVSFGEPVAFTHNITWALPMSERPDEMPGSQR
ncbi:MAG TPA: NADH-quinone oxidoreductase subunit C [Candidatus Dormibacteraeota bacterium]|nr:NADH-quinone oxidoreductase subunit C [Candidatus Dormibacteraeota bacterium]